jgi:signal transduction protein with GAF and PtsI domain
LLAIVLAGLGITGLSMAAPSLAEVRASLAARTMAECQAAAQAALAADTPAAARARVSSEKQILPNVRWCHRPASPDGRPAGSSVQLGVAELHA